MTGEFADVEFAVRDRKVSELFGAFIAAHRDGDFTTFEKLHHHSVQASVDPDVFTQNADNFRDQQLMFVLDNVLFEGDFATLTVRVRAQTDPQREDTFDLCLVFAENRYWITQA